MKTVFITTMKQHKKQGGIKKIVWKMIIVVGCQRHPPETIYWNIFFSKFF